MRRHFPVWISVALLIVIFVSNSIADYWHLYYLIWWLDIPMHILGGFWLAITALTLYFLPQRRVPQEHSALFVILLAIAAALTLGLIWEIYEYVVDKVFVVFGDQVGDTLKDLFDDLTGSVLAAWIFLRGRYNGESK